MKVPYLGYSAVLELRVKTGKHVDENKRPDGLYEQYVFYFHHTTGGGGSVGSKVNRVNKLRELVSNADLYVGSHNHQLAVLPVQSSHYKNGKVERQVQYLVDTGSFLRWEDGYAEAHQLQEAKLGCPKIRLSSHKREVLCEL